MAHERESLAIRRDRIVAVVMPPQGATDTVPDEQVRQAKSNLNKHFGSVTPRNRPEDWADLRRAFEEGVAADAAMRGQQ